MGEKIKVCIVLVLAMLILPIGLVSANNETNSTEPAIQEDPVVLENPTLKLLLTDNDIEIDQEALLQIIINPNDRAVTKIRVNWDDGSEDEYSISLSVGDEFYIETRGHEYDDEGDFDIDVDIYCESEICDSASKHIEIQKTEIPDEKPTVNLIYPDNKAQIKADKVTFRFEVEDDNKINSCDFELYKKEGTWKELDYEYTLNNPSMEKELTVSLEDFEDANYSWYVTCEDNKSQEDSEDRSFTIQTTSHAREKEIEQLLIDLDNFLEKENSMGLEEKEAMEELEITKDLKYYKKRLLQINQDLGNNIKFISDKTLRDKRILETNEELDEIKDSIPKDITVIKSEEYIKNILMNSFDDITNRYLNAKNIQMKERDIRKLSKYNLNLQEKIIVSTSIKKIEIEYTSDSKELTIVKKMLRVNDPSIKRVLEIFPDSLNEDIKFITAAGELSNNMYEINLDDLDDYEIIYHIEGDVNLNKIKDTETILFEEIIIGGNLITGMAIFDGEFSSNSVYIGIAVLIFILSGFIGIPRLGKGKLNKWKNNDNARKSVHWLRQANEAIKDKDLGLAKEKYHKIKEIYLLLPEDFKNVAYEKIEEVRVSIDKEEVKGLIKEYIKNKQQGNKKIASALYKNIKEKYTRLPKKDQQKVYDKLISLA